MITVQSAKVGTNEPILSIILAVDESLVYHAEWLVRYLVELDHPGVEVLTAVVTEESFRESPAKNLAAQHASSDHLAFTNAGVYPGASIIAKTRAELGRLPRSIVSALRIDATKDGGAWPNPFALGDWQCMTRPTFNLIGGYNESLHQAGGIESDLLSRAVANKCELVMLDERVFHAYHPSRFGEEYGPLSEENANMTTSDGQGMMIAYYPDKSFLRFSDGSVLAVSMSPQQDSVVHVTPHLPRDERYWPWIFEDKARAK